MRCVIVPLFLLFCFVFAFVFMPLLELVDVPLIFFCSADHVPDWQPRILLGMVEARWHSVENTYTCIINHGKYESRAYNGVKFPPIYVTPRTS